MTALFLSSKPACWAGAANLQGSKQFLVMMPQLAGDPAFASTCDQDPCRLALYKICCNNQKLSSPSQIRPALTATAS
jgi:hypothetical protein